LKRRQLLFAILAAALALPALAGCGGNSDPLHEVRSAATTTLGLTAQSTLSLTGARLFGGTPGTILGRAQYSFPKGLGYAALQVPALGRRASGTAYLVFQPARLWSKPLVTTVLPKGDLWISAKYAGPPPAGSPAPSVALQLESLNPQLLLKEIATGTVAARSAGHLVVNHVPLTRYIVSIDLAQALKAAGKTGALRAAIQQQLFALHARGASSQVQIVAGVDGTGRVAQLQASLPGSKLGAVQIGLSTFGSRIPLSLPLSSETVDIASLQRSHGAVAPATMFTGE
jgi:hypothetical protein